MKWDGFFCFLSSVDLFQNNPISKNSFRNTLPSECQTVWIQISPNILSGLLCVQTVCKGYQRTTLVDKKKVGVAFEKVNRKR